MTVATTTKEVVYRGNGVTVNFPYSFRIPDPAFAKVSIRNFATKVVVSVLNSGEYSITGTTWTNYSGGVVTYSPALSDVYEIVIERIVPIVQDFDLNNQGGFFADSIEQVFDKLTMIAQQVSFTATDLSSRAIRVPVGETVDVLPVAANRLGGKILGFDTSTGAVALISAATFRGSPGGSNATYDSAAHVAGLDVPEGTNLIWTADTADAWQYDSALDAAWFAAHPGQAVRDRSWRVFVRADPLRVNDLPLLPAAALGVTAGVEQDQAPAINAALAVATAAGRCLVLPDGDIYIGSPITLVNFTQLRGHSYRTTRLVHMAGVITPLFNLARDAVVQCRIGNFTVQGNESPGELGFHFRAQYAAPPASAVHGGLWYTVFSDISVSGIGGKAFWFQSTGESVNLLHQFITFRGVQVIRPPTATSRAFSATGKIGQFYFEGACEFDGPVDGSVTSVPGANMVFSREFQGPDGIRGDFVDAHNIDDLTRKPGWNVVSDERAYGIFVTGTIQSSDMGIIVDRGYVTIERTYFENLDRAVTAVSSGTVKVTSSEGRNAGGWSVIDGSGYFAATAAATLMHGSNLIAGRCDTTYKRINSGSVIALSTSLCATIPDLSVSSKPTAVQVGVVGTSIDIGSATEVFVNSGNPAQFDTIISTHTSGAIITLHAVGDGSGGMLRLYDFGNNITCREIKTGGTLNLREFDSITLQRQGQAWRVIGRSIARLESAAKPNAGLYDKGEFVWNMGDSAFVPDASNSLLLGWRRVRGGATHDLGPDWIACYVKSVSV